MGVQGYLEYASMEKIEVAFGPESVDAVIEFATIDQTWTRHNRNFSFGKRTPNTQDLIDQHRVHELIEAIQHHDDQTDEPNDVDGIEDSLNQTGRGKLRIGDPSLPSLRDLYQVANTFASLYHETSLPSSIVSMVEWICFYLIYCLNGLFKNPLFNSPHHLGHQPIELYGPDELTRNLLCGNRPRGPPRLAGLSTIQHIHRSKRPGLTQNHQDSPV